MTAAAVAQLARDIRATSSAALADELQDELRFLAEHVLSRGAHTTEAMISHARRTLAEAQATYGAAGQRRKPRGSQRQVTFQTPPPSSAAAAVEDAAEDAADDPTFDPLRGGHAKPTSFPFSPAPSTSAPASSAPPPLTLPHAPTTSVADTRTQKKKRPDSPLITDDEDDDDDDDNMPIDEVERLISARDDDGAARHDDGAARDDDDGAARHDDDDDPARPFPTPSSLLLVRRRRLRLRPDIRHPLRPGRGPARLPRRRRRLAPASSSGLFPAPVVVRVPRRRRRGVTRRLPPLCPDVFFLEREGVKRLPLTRRRREATPPEKKRGCLASRWQRLP